MHPTLRNILLIVSGVILIGGALSLVNLEKIAPTDLATFINQIQDDKIREIMVRGTKLEVTLKDGSKETVDKESNESLSELLKNYNVDPEKTRSIKTTVKEQSGFGYWAGALLPSVVSFALFLVLMIFFFKQVQGQNNHALSFGQSTAKETPKDDKSKIPDKSISQSSN